MERYHIRRREKEIEREDDMREILSGGRFASIALCRDGDPYIVTMNYGYDADSNAMYFHCAQEGLKIDYIESGGRVCATVVEDKGYRHGECDHAYRSVIIRGEISIVDDLGEKKKGLGIMLEHLEREPETIRRKSLPDDASYEKVAVLRLDIAEMTGKQG